MAGRAGSEHLKEFVDALLVANAEQAAYICGVLWEVTAEAEVAAAVQAADAVPALLHVISKNMGGAKSGKSKGAGAALRTGICIPDPHLALAREEQAAGTFRLHCLQ